MALALVVGITSCKTDDVPYDAPQPVGDDNMGVYFPSTNESMVMRADADERVIDVVVARTRTTEAAQVPISVISKTDNITCPATANFAAGEAETTIQLTYSDLLTTPKCELLIDERYGNP